jgi:IPT/TIG domain
MSGFRPILVVGLLLVLGCSTGPTAVIVPPVETMIAGGDDQYGTVGQTLPTPLHVVVRSIATDLPQKGLNILWTVEQGGADLQGIANVLTDSTGSARMTVRLGTSVGDVAIRATVQGQESSTALFRLFTVDRPELDDVAPATAGPGTSVTLTGRNFNPNAEQNVVLFSGVRGVVTSASMTRLTVTVPACLPARPVSVTVQLGMVTSTPTTISVASGGDVVDLSPGGYLDAADSAGFTCVTVPGDGNASYLVIVQSTSSVSPASHPVQVYGVSSTPPPLTPTVDTRLGDRLGAQSRRRGAHAPDAQALWDERLRVYEAEITQGRVPRADAPQSMGGARVDAPAGVPALGERRTFQVFRAPGDFVEVTAVARQIGDRAALFVDENAPPGGYTPADLQLFSDRFDDVIHPVVRASYGSESDLDGNERVVILFTPAVNALTPRGAQGFTAGFFFGLDLLPEQTGSNSAEIFYTLVPDAAGEFSDPRPRDKLLEVIPAVLAHEFEHMVVFNERVLVRGAAADDAVWLSEGMAQYAEELVARAYEASGDAVSTSLLRDGARDRARRYLADPGAVSLLISVGQGDLSERGAGFLYMLYLADRFGADLMGLLTRTTKTGVPNVEAQTGTDWGDGLSDWWSAVWLDGTATGSGDLVFPTVDLRDFLGTPYPLAPENVGAGDFVRSLSMLSSSAEYYIVTPGVGKSTTLRVGGEAGGASLPLAGTRMRIIRIQ